MLLIALLLVLSAGDVNAQTATVGAIQSTDPTLPPGLPSPSLAPINGSSDRSKQTSKSTDSTVATPQFEPAATELGPNDIGLESADQALLSDDNIDTIAGNIILRYRNYRLFADKAVIDTNKGVATLTGHIKLESDKKDIIVNELSEKSQLTIDLRRGTYNVLEGSAVIAPSAIPAVTGLLLPLRLYGGDINGSPQLIDARDTSATTCDFASPHYFFKARSTTIIPGKRLIARNVTLYRRHRKIITIPYLYFPLDDRYARQGITPQVGYDPDEGYFIKFATPYELASREVGILRLDLMSKEGIGTGFDQSFTTSGSSSSATTPGRSTSAAMPSNGPSTVAPFQTGGIGIFGSNALNGGTVQLYHLNDNSGGLNTTTGSLTDSQMLFDKIRLSIDGQFQNDDYLSSADASTAISGQFELSRSVKGGSTSLTTNIQDSNYGLGTSQTVTSSFVQQNAISKTTTTLVKLNVSQFSTPSFDGISGTVSDTYASDFDLTSQPKGYLFELQTNTFDSSSSTPGEEISGGVQRLPELTLQSVPTVQDQLLKGIFPPLTHYLIDLGDFDETEDNTNALRAQFGLDIGANHHKHRAVTTDYTGSILQSYYSDNAAQYILKDQLQESYAFQKKSTVGVSYSYLRPYGYTPFLFDQTGSFNNLNVNLNYQPTNRLTATASSGFNISQDHEVDGIPAAPWLDINGQITYAIAKRLSNILTGSYDPNRGMLFNVSDTTRITLPWGMAFNSALNYVPQTSNFSNISGDLDLPMVTDKKEDASYRLRLLASYDGETHIYNYQAFELTRSWHDWELSEIYQDNTNNIPGNSFFINFRLKAFPGYEPFGVGQYGQGLSTGTGQVY